MTPENILGDEGRFFGGKWYRTQAGGGNISIKDEDYLYIKASGTTLKNMSSPGNVAKIPLKELKNTVLSALCGDFYMDPDEFVKSFITKTGLSPSVESCFHCLGPEVVVHTHLTGAISVSSSFDAQSMLQTLEKKTGYEIRHVKYARPGFPLAKEIYSAVKDGESKVFMLQNHGIVIFGDEYNSVRNIFQIMENTLFEIIGEKLTDNHNYTAEECGNELFKIKASGLIKDAFIRPLTPDFVLHFGAGLRTVDDKDEMISKGLYYYRGDYFISGYMDESLTGALEIVAQQQQCYNDTKGKLRFLFDSDIQDILNWGPGKYSAN
ncbi:MAG: class II aldolase/adducin family protein [Deltaproteobacteria bacterium]|nr:class II aldolase/adducin family protein [Deltaproteobacteria bacterium]